MSTKQSLGMSMQIMFRFLSTLSACISLAACAEATSTAVQEKREITISKNNWSAMSYADWDRMLKVTDKCPAKFDGSMKRFVNIRELNDSTSLLAISCELGAYQDGKLLYLLHSDKASPFTPVLPTFESKWSLGKQTIVWGNRYTEGGYLVLENWYAGSGECGYRAFYPIVNVITQPSPQPEKVFGDSNCEDGVYVDDWPLVESFK